MLFKKIFPLIIVSFFAFVAGLPLLHEGLIPTHDGEYHVVRFFLFNESFLDGNLYPRWAAHLNNGFGVPLFNFVYPLPNYIAVFLHGFGVSFIDTFKFEMFVATLIGAVFFYLWGKEFWGKLGGVISSIFYTFSPYHFVDIYVRGSVGEVWALAFFPAFLWGFTRFVMTKQRIFLVFSSLLLVLTILSHNILALMFFIFSLLYIALLIYREKNKKYLILNTLCAILFSLGLSAIFWLPAIYETKYVTGLQIFDIASHFPSLYQLLIPSWGSGFRGTGLQNEMSYQIGAANLIAVFFSIVIIFFQIKRKSSKLPYTVFFLTCFIIVFFLMLSVSLPMWKIIPFMNNLQFPWRLLSLEILF
ncbi:MAG: 6-pyruvoyl-tetrahydropterin synthase-related protein, partial [Candidatus Levybacteria bacterium]|nr:6-pyruvoyl-tetrahydropterin synthase-related protein [Candidatus Levybacteria bacterium]